MLLVLTTAGVVGLCFAAMALGMALVRRRRLGACSCGFDPDRARAGGCAGCADAPPNASDAQRTPAGPR